MYGGIPVAYRPTDGRRLTIAALCHVARNVAKVLRGSLTEPLGPDLPRRRIRSAPTLRFDDDVSAWRHLVPAFRLKGPPRAAVLRPEGTS